MAHISGTFANPSAGRLSVTLTGSFLQGTNRDAGFPSGASNMLVRAVVDGAGGPPIDRYAPVTTFELDYPGGNALWSVSTVTVATTTSGIAVYGFSALKLVLRLTKK
jgi:hypothetical protein